MYGGVLRCQVTRLIPSNALILDEKTWMAYPYIRTTISIPFFNKVSFKSYSGRVIELHLFLIGVPLVCAVYQGRLKVGL